jgi:hypothetical protein
MNTLTRERAAPIMLASMSGDAVGTIFLDPELARQQMGDKTVGERMFRVEYAHRFFVFDQQYDGRSDRCHGTQVKTLAWER